MKIFSNFTTPILENKYFEKQRSISTIKKRDSNRNSKANLKQNDRISNDFPDEKKKLPANFAENLLYLELELEKDNFNMKDLNKLLELYTLAIGYYDSIHDSRYLFFKKKLQSIWSKNNVIEAMNNEISKKEEPRTKIKTLENQQRQKEIEMNVEYVKKNKKWISKEIVETIGQQKKKNDNLVNHEIFGQKNDILQKIEARKNRACSLPHQILEARKMDNYRFKNGQTKQEKLRI